jgi:hypothetical protein
MSLEVLERLGAPTGDCDAQTHAHIALLATGSKL